MVKDSEALQYLWQIGHFRPSQPLATSNHMKSPLKIFALLASVTLSVFALVHPDALAVNLLSFVVLGACAELTAFRTATESLDQRVRRSPRLGRAMFWRNLIPMGTYMKNVGLTRSTFTVKTSEPQDNQSLWQAITLSNGQPSPGCSRTYEDVGVNFFERTYSPRERAFQGPVICKKNLTFQHNPGAFLSAYVDEMGKFIARVWEMTLRRDYASFVPVYVDGVKYSGPNALATAPRAYQGLSQQSLNVMAAGQINVGAGSEENGYTTFGNGGPVFPLEIDMVDSETVLTSNATIREDSRFASEGKDGQGNFALWKGIGADRVIGNFRHVPTPIPLRLNYTGGAYQVVTPFKDITTVGSDSEILTEAYKSAAFGVSIMLEPRVFTAEAVLPESWPFKTIDGQPDPTNYNGEFTFIAGAERVCSPAEFDPLHEKGRHFAVISYAPAPDLVNLGAILVYKRCPATSNAIYCS